MASAAPPGWVPVDPCLAEDSESFGFVFLVESQGGCCLARMCRATLGPPLPKAGKGRWACLQLHADIVSILRVQSLGIG